MSTEKRWKMRHHDGIGPDLEDLAEADVLECCPVDDEQLILDLAVGDRHVDRDCDIWERIA